MKQCKNKMNEVFKILLQYTGLWYEYKRYPLIFEFLGKCVTATYTAQSDGKIGVFNEQINAL